MPFDGRSKSGDLSSNLIPTIICVECNITFAELTQNGKTSNSAELVFYVLKKIAQRSFETYDINAACAIINHIYNCLDCDYKEWLD